MTEIVTVGFGEGTGTVAADSSGSGRNITSVPGWMASQAGHGNCMTVNGNGGQISLPALSSYTIMFWFRSRSAPGYSTFLEDLAAADFWFEFTGTAVDVYWTSGAQNYITGWSFTANTWTHATLTYNGTSAQLYVNGTAFGSPFAGGGALPATTYIVGGNTDAPGNMELDDFRVFDTALTAGAIAATYAASVESGGTTPVSTTRSTTWNVAALPPASTFDSAAFDPAAFHVGTTPVSTTRSTTWDTLASVSRTRSTTWNVASAKTPVSTTRSTTWRTKARVTQTRSTTWNTLGTLAPFVTAMSANGRYFVDQNGAPILVKGDAPWAIIMNSSQAQVDLYVSTRASQGFNLALVSLLGAVANGAPSDTGATYDGVLPFVGGDPAVLNATYWDRVEYFIAKCRDAGITVMAYPIDGWVGLASYNGLAQSWSNATAQAYGAAIAARLNAYPNIIWGLGGDYSTAEGAANDQRQWNVLLGAAGAGMVRPNTMQFTLDQTSMASTYWDDKVDWNFVYSYEPNFLNVEAAWGQTKPGGANLPALASEMLYEDNPSPTVNNRYLRSVVAWALTSGSFGDIYGRWGIWNAAPTSGLLASTAVNHIKAIRTAFQGLTNWEQLVPDYSSTFITAGRGTKTTGAGTIYASGNTYVTGAISPNGRLAVVYMPAATSQTITINQAKLGSGYTAKWVDPTNGAVTSATTGSTYTKTGANAAGDPDWLLIFESSNSVLAQVSTTRSTTWRVKATVTATRSTTWDAVARVTTTRATTWDVLTPVSTTRATTWNTKAPVSTTRSTTWNAKARATQTRSTTWNVAGSLAQVSTTRSTTWNVKARVTQTRATTWDVLTPVTATRSTTWDVTTAVSITRSTTWDVLTPVSTTRSTTYDVLARVTQTRSTTWNVAGAPAPTNPVSTTRSTTWDVRTVATTTRATTWDVLGAVATSRSTTWNVARALAPVATTRSTTWDVLQRATATRTTTWDVLTGLLVTRNTTWDSLARLAVSRSTTWNVAALPITGSRNLVATLDPAPFSATLDPPSLSAAIDSRTLATT